MWDWEFTGRMLPDLLSGLRITVQVTVIGYLIALAVGLVVAMLRRVRGVGPVVHAVMEFIRTTPLVVQVLAIFFLLPPEIPKFIVGTLAIGLHYSAYTAEVYRSGIEGVAKGQWEACTALSLPRRRVWGAVVLPQAIRKVIPPLGNYLIAMFKDTPLLFAIGVAELLTKAQTIAGQSFRDVEPYTMVGLLFLAVSVPSAILIRRLERRYAAV